MRGERYFLSRPMMSVMLITGLALLGAGRAEAVDPPHLGAAKVESLRQATEQASLPRAFLDGLKAGPSLTLPQMLAHT